MASTEISPMSTRSFLRCFARHIAQAPLDAKLGVELNLVGELAEVGVGVEQADLARQLEVAAGNFFRAFERASRSAPRRSAPRSAIF